MLFVNKTHALSIRFLIVLLLLNNNTYDPNSINIEGFRFEDIQIGYSLEFPQDWAVVSATANSDNLIIYETLLYEFYKPEMCSAVFSTRNFDDKAIKAVFSYLDEEKDCSNILPTGIIVGLDGFTPPIPIPSLVLMIKNAPRVISAETIITDNNVTVGVIQIKDKKNYPEAIVRLNMFSLSGGTAIIVTIFPTRKAEIIQPSIDQIINSIIPDNSNK